MAVIKIDGKIERIFQDGRCVKVVESTEKDGKTYTSRYTAWFENSPGLVEGQQVNISGFLSVKQGKPWTDRENIERTSIDVNINRARVDADKNGPSNGATGSPASQQVGQQEPWAAPTKTSQPGTQGGADVWNTPANDNDETPF